MYSVAGEREDGVRLDKRHRLRDRRSRLYCPNLKCRYAGAMIEDGGGITKLGMVSTLSCPECRTHLDVSHVCKVNIERWWVESRGEVYLSATGKTIDVRVQWSLLHTG